MASSLQIVLAILLLYGVAFCSAEMEQSGSGGNQTDPCDDVVCHGGGTCYEDDDEAKCNCPVGKATYDNDYMCETCALGEWGINCNKSCADNCGGKGHFESCNAVDGTCECNSCWMGGDCSTGTGGEAGYSCVLDYLESISKDLDPYGGQVPRAEIISLQSLADELVQDTGSIVQSDSVSMDVVDRDEVDARPLMRFSFTLKEGPGNTDYDNAIDTIKDKVKTGEIRGTLIIDESDEDSGKVTLNA